MPSERSSHSAIYDPARDRMVVMGGHDDGIHSDLWELTLSGSPTWSALAPAGSPPNARYGHTAFYDPVRDRMVVFGGRDSSGDRNDVWALSLAERLVWSPLAPAGIPPSGRHSHTAIYDPFRDRMVVFGGNVGSGWRNDVWTLSLAEAPAWNVLAPAGTPPPGRYGHTAIYDPVRDRMVVFGGYDGSRLRNDVWALSLAGSLAWSSLTAAGDPPIARYEHTAFYDPVRDRMVVFGGADFRGRNDVWALSLAGSPAWSAITSGGPLSGRHGHSAIYDTMRDRIVVFGGSDGSGYHNDVWALPMAGTPAWTAISPPWLVPSGRSWPTAIYDPGRVRIIMFGGYDGRRNPNDLWTLSLSGSPAWGGVSPTWSWPPGRHGHSAIYDAVRDRMVVFGGYDFGFRNDVWTLSLSGSAAWSALAAAGTWPAARALHTAIYDPVRDRMVVFGGSDASYNLLSDVWALSLAGSPAWSQLSPSGTRPSARYLHSAIYDPVRDRIVVFGGQDSSGQRNDVWALSLAGSPAWSLLAPAGGLPAARNGHSAIFDPLRERMVVFGGWERLDGSYYNDAWALSLAGSPEWSVLAPAGSPPPGRHGHAAIYDPSGDRMVVFGGSSLSLRSDVWALTWGMPPVPALISLSHAEAKPDRVSLTWYGSESAALTGSVERREPTTDWQRLATISADGTGTFRYDDREVAPGARYVYRLVYRDDTGAETFTAETWVEVPRTVSLALEGLRPNPAGGELVAVFALPDDSPAALAMLDVTGRRVLGREVGSLGAGRHTLRLGHARGLPTGVYWLRLERSGQVLGAKALILR